jgi:hypothetical protein
MEQNSQAASINLSYLAVLLLLAYVLSSAPKYIRNFRENHNDIKIETISPIKKVLKIGRYYAVDPYLRAWNRLVPGRESSIVNREWSAIDIR